MTDPEFLLLVFRGDQDAVDLVLMLARIADTHDNLIDQDVPVTKDQINDAFYQALIQLPRNAFYRRHMDDLLPLMAAGMFNWWTANEMEKGDSMDALEISHVIRYGIADVAIFIAGMIGGRSWVEQHGPELRMRSQRSNLSEYLTSLGKKAQSEEAK